MLNNERLSWVFSTVFVLLISTISSLAQDQRLADSLIIILDKGNLSYNREIELLREVSFNLTDPNKSLTFADEVVSLATKEGDHINLYRGHYLRGMAFDIMGRLDDAIEAYFDAAKEADNSNYQVGLVEVFLALGDVYSNQSNHTNTIFYYSRALRLNQAIAEDQGDTLNLAGIMTNLGHEFYKVGSLDSALYYLELGRKLFAGVGYTIGELYCKGNVGLVYAKRGEFDIAETKMRQAINGLIEYEDYYAISDFTHEIADIYRNKEDFEKALYYAVSSLNMAKSNGLLIQARDATYAIYEVYMAIGQHEQAITYLNSYYLLKDSINNEEAIQKIADLRTEYEVGQKQAEVDVLTAQQKTERVVMAAIAALAVILLVLGLIIFKYYKQKSRISVELTRLNETKDKFFSIISHDLRGPISSFLGISRMIKFLVEARDTEQLLEVADDIDESVDRLTSLLDNLLSWAMQQQGHFPNVPEKVSLNEIAREVVGSLDNMARGKQIDLEVDLTESIYLWVDRNTTMTILRNLVNNALKFTPLGGEVSIIASHKGDFAIIRVEDTGVGIPQHKLKTLFRLQDKKSTYGTSGEKGLGLGLQLVYEFVEMNKGGIDVRSTEGKGTTFEIRLPLFERVGANIVQV